ncbi:hypothetical protein J2Y48_004552 [Mycoplana sp. BE70]|uniref:hypothetical protein n=1 Tax=Mycoplana sp. BE70 TaxID=2817775 RepID=UPI00286322B9|nr:hypothetical protein [Mycoplana sp. BE70]MDR6759236.1 hypothetical protein [Mycoplana sp. BE70]
MPDDDAILSAGAVALSAAATVSSLILHLRHIDAIDEQSECQIYKQALTMLEQGQGDDSSGVFDAACELLESQLRAVIP